jgi:hypothetical protein
MVSITRNSKYKSGDISITYSSEPIVPPQHLIHAGGEEMERMGKQEKMPSFFFPPKMVIRFKDEEININENFHTIRTYGGRYFTHYFPYRFFESPLNLSQTVLNSLIAKDEINQLKKKEGYGNE